MCDMICDYSCPVQDPLQEWLVKIEALDSSFNISRELIMLL